MKLTQELIDKIQEAMLHTNLKGEINWKDGDDIEVQIAGTFAKDKFIVLKNASKNPFENAQPHPHFDYEKKVFTKDGREEYMKEQEKLKKLVNSNYRNKSYNRLKFLLKNQVVQCANQQGVTVQVDGVKLQRQNIMQKDKTTL